jgi:hypothetical protein
VLSIEALVLPRPAILIAEPEPQQALSTRKLVVETGKFNVLTAHSTQEALDAFFLFPNISAAVLVISEAVDADLIAGTIKRAKANTPVICLPRDWQENLSYFRRCRPLSSPPHLQNLTEMKPVVVKPDITLEQSCPSEQV